MTSRGGPVSDWATDLDHADPECHPDSHPTWSDLRQAGCPVAHSVRDGERGSLGQIRGPRELPIRVLAAA